MDSNTFAKEMASQVAAFCAPFAETPPAYSYIPLIDDAQRAKVMQARLWNEIRAAEVLGSWIKTTPERDVKAVMADVYDNKCYALNQLIEQNREDPDLVRAYESKISKEQAGKARARDAHVQHGLRAELAAIIEKLEETLHAVAGDWLLGGQYSLADLMWGISLYRLQWLGLGYLWDECPQVSAYRSRAYKRPSVGDAVINWPSPMPASPHTAELEQERVT